METHDQIGIFGPLPDRGTDDAITTSIEEATSQASPLDHGACSERGGLFYRQDQMDNRWDAEKAQNERKRLEEEFRANFERLKAERRAREDKK